jgi:hypothetical protein
MNPSASASVAAAQAQFDQFSLWNDAEPSAHEWTAKQQQQHQRHSHAPVSGRGAAAQHQLFPQTNPAAGVAPLPLSSQQPFTARPDANFHHPSSQQQHRAAADAAAAARVDSRTHYGATHGRHGASAASAAAAAAAADLAGVSALDTSRANERVEKRFLYWKNFWSNIQQMRAKTGVAGASGAAGDAGVDVSIPLSQAARSGTSKSTAAGADSSSLSSVAQQAQLFGMSEQEFRTAMAEFGGDLPADVDVSFTGPDADAHESVGAPAATHKKHGSPQKGTTSASTGAHGPSSVSTAAGNPAAFAAFQAYQAQFSSPGKAAAARAAASSSSSVGRSPSASKKSSNIDAAQKFEREQATAAASVAATAQPTKAAPAAPVVTAAAAPTTSAAPKPAVAAPAATDVSTAAAATHATAAAATAATAAAAVEAERKRQSNVERFWAEEQARAGKPRASHVGPGGGSKSKASSKAAKAALHFVAPEDTGAAKDMWQKMKAELDDKWTKFAGAASPTEDNKQQKQQPSSQQQQPAAQPPRHTSQQQQPSAKPSAGDTTAREPNTAAAQGTDSYSPSNNNRRASAYAFTNIRKEDLSYRAAPAGSGAAAAAAAAAAQPAAAAANPASRGAQFSSFTRPPPPHTSSSGGGAMSAAHAAAVAVGKGRAFELYSGFSVRALRTELLSLGVSAGELARLVEKDEMVTRLLSAQSEGARRAEAAKAEAERRAEAKAKAAAVDQNREQLRERIVHEVSRWAQGRHIKSMLNELNGLASIDAPGYLKRTDAFACVSKAYKKALLRIHPDKHMSGADGVHDGKYLRATEVFKYVSQAFDEYKKKLDK